MVTVIDRNGFPGFIAAFRPFLGKRIEAAGKETYDKMIDEWESGRDVKGRPWEPLAASTIESKGGDTPLIETRQMIDSTSFEANERNLQVGIEIDSEYAAVHEFGAPDQGIPARPILQPAADVMAQNMHPAVASAIDKAYGSAGSAGLGMAMGVGSMGNNVR